MVLGVYVFSSCDPDGATEPSALDAPLALAVVSGNDQSGRPGAELPDPLVVRVLRDGVPVTGQIVNFRVVEGGGSVFAGVSLSDGQGLVQEIWTLGPTVGEAQRVEARAVDTGSGAKLVLGVFHAVTVSNVAPVARIDQPAGDVTVTVGTAIDFRGTASDADGTVVAHLWTLGDGNVATVEDPGPYVYAAPGAYRVTYRVTDAEGATSALDEVEVVVRAPNQAPTSTIDQPAQNVTVTLGQAVDFRGSAYDPDGTIAAHLWAFGDGNGAAVEDPGPHVYAALGSYTVSYRVTDNEGATSSPSSVTVVVQAQEASENYALRFFGNGASDVDRIKIRIDDPSTADPGPPVDVGATDFTIEFWLRALPGENGAPRRGCSGAFDWIYGNILFDRDRYNQSRSYGISLGGGSVMFGVWSTTGIRTICGTARVDDGAWHHVAVTRTRSNGALRIFVDGVVDASITSGPTGDISYPDNGAPGNYCNGPCVNDPFIVIGAEKHDAGPLHPPFSGWLDEIRFSTVLRYTTAFSRPTSGFSPDAATVGLFTFDEGSGDAIRDSSGAPGSVDGLRRFGGSPPGPVWVISNAPTGR